VLFVESRVAESCSAVLRISQMKNADALDVVALLDRPTGSDPRLMTANQQWRPLLHTQQKKNVSYGSSRLSNTAHIGKKASTARCQPFCIQPGMGRIALKPILQVAGSCSLPFALTSLVRWPISGLAPSRWILTARRLPASRTAAACQLVLSYSWLDGEHDERRTNSNCYGRG